jgi:hypothetical protein
MQKFLLLSLLFLAAGAHAQTLTIPANWKVGDAWHYELLWTIDAPEMRGDNPPTTMLAYPVLEVLEADKDGYTLSVHCDSARVVTGPTGQQARAAVVHLMLSYRIRTNPEGRYAGIQNPDSLSAQLLGLFQKVYMKSDAASAHKQTTAFPDWAEAHFLRDYGFIFDAYGRTMKNGLEAELPVTPGRKFYFLYNYVPLDITFFDEKFGKPTVMAETMTFFKENNRIRVEAEGHFTHPAIEEVQGPFTFQYEEKKGYYRSSAAYDPQTGSFLEGELVFGTSGGGGQYFFEGKPEKMPQQLIEERRTFKPFSPKKPTPKPADLPGVALPVFPKFEQVVYFFYQHYKGSAVPEFRLEKHPEGYRITRLFDNGLPMFTPEIIWSPESGFRQVRNFDKPEPVEPGAPDRLVAVFDSNRWSEEADWYIRKNDFVRRECDRLPYYGYPGYSHDVIRLWEPQYESLSNEQLHGLARAYSAAAAGLLNNNSGMADSTRMFRLEATPNALSPEQLAQYKAAHQKAVDAYALLLRRDPGFPTPVGSVAVKYANEVVDGFLTLSYYQNEKEARPLLKPDIYGPHILQAARNTLLSCPQDAVLISQGDSDTYPLLYLQAMEKLRTDVIVANSSLLQTRPYLEHILRGPLGAKPLNGLPQGLFWAPDPEMSDDLDEKRPLCFSLTCARQIHRPWKNDLALEGLVYRVDPGKQAPPAGMNIAIAEDRSLHLWLRTFRFGAPDTPLPPEMRPFYYTHLIAGRDLAKALREGGRCKEALAVAALLDQHFTNTMTPRNSQWLEVVETLAACGNIQDAERIGLQVWDNFRMKKLDEEELKMRDIAILQLRETGAKYGVEKLKAIPAR